MSDKELPPFEAKIMTPADWPLCLMFGDTPVCRVVNSLMAMPTFSYSVEEIAKFTELTRQTVAKAIKSLDRFHLVRVTKEGKTTVYQWDATTPQAQGFKVLLRSLIDVIVEEEIEYGKTHAPMPIFEGTEHDLKLLLRGELKTMPEGHQFKLKESKEG